MRAFAVTTIVCVLFVVVPVFVESADNRLSIDSIMIPEANSVLANEEYVYEVRWTLFRLGTIRIRSYGNLEAKAWIDSYDIPFVNLHSIYYTRMDSSFFSLGGYSIDKGAQGWEGLNYIPDWSGKKLMVEQIRQTDASSEPYYRLMTDTLDLTSSRFVDGLSIGFLPRLLVHSRQFVKVPTVLNGKSGTTTFLFEGKVTQESIEALDEPVRVVEVKGNTSAEGIYGMTGDFTGWFSDDDAAVPIKGKLKVLIGNVTVELIRWKRGDWTLPQ